MYVSRARFLPIKKEDGTKRSAQVLTVLLFLAEIVLLTTKVVKFLAIKRSFFLFFLVYRLGVLAKMFKNSIFQWFLNQSVNNIN